MFENQNSHKIEFSNFFWKKSDLAANTRTHTHAFDTQSEGAE